MSDEEEIVKRYIEWANKNSIPLVSCSVEDIEEFMLRHRTAAG